MARVQNKETRKECGKAVMEKTAKTVKAAEITAGADNESKEILNLELIGLPPTVNHMYRTGYKSRYKTLEVREYQNYAVSKMRERWTGRQTCTGRLELRLIFTTDDKRRWDIDNRVKALQDCLSIAGVIRDDSQLDALHVERCYGKEKGTRIILAERGVISRKSKES